VVYRLANHTKKQENLRYIAEQGNPPEYFHILDLLLLPFIFQHSKCDGAVKEPLWNILVFLSFFLIWGDTRSLCMPALRPVSQAGPMRNPREGTSVVLHDTVGAYLSP